MQCRPLVIKVPMLWHKLLSLGLLCWVKKTNLAGARMFVCPSIIDIGVRTAGPNGTGRHRSTRRNGGKTMMTVSAISQTLEYILSIKRLVIRIAKMSKQFRYFSLCSGRTKTDKVDDNTF